MKKLIAQLHLFTVALIIAASLILVFCQSPQTEFNAVCLEAVQDLIIDKNDYDDIVSTVMQMPPNHRQRYLDIINDSARFKGHLARLARVEPQEIVLAYLNKNDEELKIERIKVYIETSASMRGYMHGGTKYQDIVNYLFGSIERKYVDQNVMGRAVTEGVIFDDDNASFTENLTRGTFNWGRSSPLNEVFKSLIDSTKQQDISILVSDGIMAGTNEQIRNNPRFDIEQRVLLQNNIMRVFTPKRNELAMAIYGFKSDFNTNQARRIAYYDYRNVRHHKSFSQRPFYVFVFGNKKLLPDFIEFLENEANFDYLEALYIGVQNPVNDYQPIISHYTNRNYIQERVRSNAVIQGNTKNIQLRRNAEISPENPMRFSIGINLSNFPVFYHDVEYLQNNISIKRNPNIDIGEYVVRPFTSNTLEALNRRERDNNLTNTHYIDFSINNVYNNDILSFSINNIGSQWYIDWSCDDDSSISADDNKTFNFKYMIQGIIDGLQLQNVAEIEVPVRVH